MFYNVFLLNVFKFIRQPSLQRDNYLIKALTWNKKNKDSLTDIENCLLAILESFWWNIIKPGPLPLFAEIRHCLL